MKKPKEPIPPIKLKPPIEPKEFIYPETKITIYSESCSIQDILEKIPKETDLATAYINFTEERLVYVHFEDTTKEKQKNIYYAYLLKKYKKDLIKYNDHIKTYDEALLKYKNDLEKYKKDYQTFINICTLNRLEKEQEKLEKQLLRNKNTIKKIKVSYD